MAKPKDYVVMCIDVGPMMSMAPPSGGDTPLDMSLKIAGQIVAQKLHAGGKDDVGVVLFGTADTDHNLDQNGDQYRNITTSWQLVPPSVDLLVYLKDKVQPGTVSADFIDAIVVSMDALSQATQSAKKIGRKVLYLFTNAASEYSDDQLDGIASGLKLQGIELIIIGPDLQLDDDDDDDNSAGGGDGRRRQRGRPGHDGGCSSSEALKSAQQEAGEQLLTRLAREVDGVSFSFMEAMNTAAFIRKIPKKQTTLFSGCLEIGTNLKIPCKIFTKTMVERPATWKKLSAVSQSSAQPGDMKVLIDRSYHLQDEDETEVDKDNVAKGYRYGKSLIPVSSTDEEAVKMNAPRGLSLLGFSKLSNVKPHSVIGSSVKVVVANPDHKPAAVSMSALIRSMYETECVAIVRYVWRNKADPKLCMLLPHIKPDQECLLMVQLPFMEDLRQFTFTSLTENNKHKPSEAQLNAIDGLIDGMDLMEADVNAAGVSCEAVKTKLINNPVIQRTFQCIQCRALDKTAELPSIEPTLERCLNPSQQLLTSCNSKILKIKDLFPLNKVEIKKTNAAAVAEAWKQSDIDLDPDAPPSKRIREDDGEDETDYSMASLARGEITEVGTRDPVGDYTKLVNKRNTDFANVSEQLQQVVLSLIKDSLGETLYDKAMKCVQVLREECCKRVNPEIFNKFMRETKLEVTGTRYAPFWQKIVAGGVSLITSEECAASTVTADEAQQFIADEPEAEEAPAEEAANESDDAEDLLAMM